MIDDGSGIQRLDGTLSGSAYDSAVADAD